MILDIILKVFEKMRPIDLISVRTLNQTCKYYIDIILKKKMKLFQKSLNCPQYLFDILNENTMMSGSCMVHFLLEERYIESDIDIFMNKTDFILLHEYLIKHDYKCDNTVYPDRYPPMFKVFNFEKENKTKIQLIVCKDVKNNILNFDFNIVKNYYDGKNIIIKDINNLSKKKELLEVVFHDELIINSTRLDKYINRGFNFEIKRSDMIKIYKYKYKSSCISTSLDEIKIRSEYLKKCKCK